MKINKLNISKSNVTMIDNSSNVNAENYGLTIEEFGKLYVLINKNIEQINNEIKDFKEIKSEIDLTEKKKANIINILKKFGIDFASKLTASGIIEIFKYIITSSSAV